MKRLLDWLGALYLLVAYGALPLTAALWPGSLNGDIAFAALIVAIIGIPVVPLVVWRFLRS